MPSENSGDDDRRSVDSFVEEANGDEERRHEDAEKQVMNMISRETSFVQRWRLFFVLTIFVVAASVTITIWFYLEDQEEESFESAFNEAASTLIAAVRSSTENVEKAIAQMSDTITSVAQEKNATFPFVTLSNFGRHADYVRELTGASFVISYMIVKPNEREAWNEHSVEEANKWVPPDLELGSSLGFEENIVPGIWHFNTSTQRVDFDVGPGPWVVSYQVQPLSQGVGVNADKTEDPVFVRRTKPVDELKSVVFSETYQSVFALGEQRLTPRYQAIAPIFDSFNETNRAIAGYLVAVLVWRTYLEGILADGVDGIYVVLKNSCGQSFTWEVFGPQVDFLGVGDFHDKTWNSLERSFTIGGYEDRQVAEEAGACTYELFFYPSSVFRKDREEPESLLFVVLVAIIFTGMTITFVVYDRAVQKRNAKVIANAAKSNEFLSSLFPTNVKDRILGTANDGNGTDKSRTKNHGGKALFRSFIDTGEAGEESDDPIADDPIADLFSNTTIMFADLAGFTAWSSAREPVQVFKLLESLYQSFDEMARKRKVFKVETIGDCYVAAAGLPEPRKDHATVMAKFAFDCLSQTAVITKKLERTLGPDTGDLNLRVGLHSGAVTAGVLRGDRARFQLFGDTMNTASRMESTGKPGRIQVSQETADLLIVAKKGNWLQRREEKVFAKGKGDLVTYWLTVQEAHSTTTSLETLENNLSTSLVISNGKHDRLIEWVVDTLLPFTSQVVARRQVLGISSDLTGAADLVQIMDSQGCTPLDLQSDVLDLPEFDEKLSAMKEIDVVLDSKVVEQLRGYVRAVASTYADLPFHSFEHASHVTMSVTKLLHRVICPPNLKDEASLSSSWSATHNHSFGMASDPLTQLACVLSAVIHDACHPGVSNAQLVKEGASMAVRYNGKSVAEQNSVDIAWGLLMDSQFSDLRACIMPTEEEAKRFRQVLFNAVLATDIFDPERKASLRSRWDRAFKGGDGSAITKDEMSLKAAVTVDYIVQASDVSHTMQHWHVYLKWNNRLFQEMTNAYESGRLAKNPVDFWYEGELGFFDNYVIPLADKLQSCGGVFGVNADECMVNAKQNRKEWESKGQDLVSDWAKGIERNSQSG